MLSKTDDLLSNFSRTTDQLFSMEEFRTLLESGRQIRIKFGVDVTAPHLHIGHAVNLWMMRRLQDMGHKVIFLIGDFTTRIGDPTGKNRLRPVIPPEEIIKNTERFISQAGRVLRFDNPDLLEIRKNSEWLDTLSAQDLIKLLSMITHNRLLSRDMFQKRISSGDDIHMHEILYPVLQGYDSVALKSDLTIIGSDQLFNEMLGRFYQERMGQPPQVILTTRITPGIDGGEKQSKSLDNYIGLDHSPRDKFGRAMRIPDKLIPEYFEVYTAVPMEDIAIIRAQLREDPMGCKKRLAWHIVERYHGSESADIEKEWFDKTFSAKETPEEMAEIVISPDDKSAFEVLRKCFGPEKSNSEVRRLIQQGGMQVNGDKILEPNQVILFKNGDVIKTGKRTWVRVALRG